MTDDSFGIMRVSTAILGPFPLSQGHGRDSPKWINYFTVILLVGGPENMDRIV